jgi:hypothetical protein
MTLKVRQMSGPSVRRLVIVAFLQFWIFVTANVDAAQTILQCDLTQCPSTASCPPSQTFSFDPNDRVGRDAYGDEVLVDDRQVRTMSVPTDGRSVDVSQKTLDRYTAVMTENLYLIDSETAKTLDHRLPFTFQELNRLITGKTPKKIYYNCKKVAQKF